MAISKRHAVTVLLTEDHLRKMIDNHLLKEEDIADRVKVARIVQKLLSGALDLPDRPWHDWDDWVKGLGALIFDAFVAFLEAAREVRK